MSEVKVNKISPRTACGTVTMGDSGDTIAIGAGVTTTGMGRTGTVDWITTVKVTGDSPITGVDGKGYFLNTTAGTITVNLPAGAAGSILAFKDYAGTWDTNAVTVTPDGSEKIGGLAGSGTLSTERQSVTLIYIDSTQGWLDIHDSASNVRGPLYVTATGGTPCAGATSGDYKIHTFTGPGTLVVSCGGNPSGNDKIDYLVVAGGGSGATYVSGTPSSAGGGGAGGFRESVPSPAAWTASPIASPGGALPVTATPYPIVVGGGGAAAGPGAPVCGIKGTDSSFDTITSTGGGLGGNAPGPSAAGGPGGSGGGGGSGQDGCVGGTGNDPATSPAQGFDGGSSPPAPGPPKWGSGGGGGATEAGVDGTPTAGGRGGAGATTCISASPTAYAGGGGGSTGTAPSNAGAGSPCGTGGAASCAPTAATSGTTNRGGGGGGHGTVVCTVSGAGGSGIVVIRYKFQN